MSISSAPESIAYFVSNNFDSIGTWPLGKYEDTAATLTLEFCTFSLAIATKEGYTHTAATLGTEVSKGLGLIAFATIWDILPSVSSPSRVVRSHIVTIIFSASNFESFFMLLVASEFTLSFNPTESIRDSYTISKTLDHCIETSEVFIFPIILC